MKPRHHDPLQMLALLTNGYDERMRMEKEGKRLEPARGNDMQMEGEEGREEGEREMCCLEEIHSAEERRQTASMSICLTMGF